SMRNTIFIFFIFWGYILWTTGVSNSFSDKRFSVYYTIMPRVIMYVNTQPLGPNATTTSQGYEYDRTHYRTPCV
ncbi:hypothetical protein L9F63_025173, partial [Diploptera punctata]